MNTELEATAFFDLSEFRHRELFEGTQFVWEALARIEPYLRTLSGRDLRGRVSSGAWLEGDLIVIGEGSTVEPGAYIEAPCVIGRNCQIRHGAYLRGNVIAGDGCVLGHATEAKGSLLLNGAKAGHFAYLGDSILGNDVNLGAGTKLANLRLDGAVVTVKRGNELQSTGRRKLGAILGDRTETGCNSVTNPGTLLGKGSLLFPCQTAAGYHPPGSRLGKRS